MTRIINNTNPATPTTLKVSSSTDNVLIEAASSALDGLEDGLADGELATLGEPARPELPDNTPFALIEFAPLESPESREPDPEPARDSLLH